MTNHEKLIMGRNWIETDCWLDCENILIYSVLYEEAQVYPWVELNKIFEVENPSIHWEKKY